MDQDSALHPGGSPMVLPRPKDSEILIALEIVLDKLLGQAPESDSDKA